MKILSLLCAPLKAANARPVKQHSQQCKRYRAGGSIRFLILHSPGWRMRRQLYLPSPKALCSLIGFLLVCLCASAFAEANFVFETNAASLALDGQGRAVSLRDKAAGKEWLQDRPSPFFAVKNNGRWHPSTSLRKVGDRYVVDFGRAHVSATYAITANKDYIVVELADLQGDDVEAIRLLQIRTNGLDTAGYRLAVRWNEEFAVVPIGLSSRVHLSLGGPNGVNATVYAEFGIKGEKVALVPVPTERLMGTIHALERDFSLPSPTIDGQWAKESDANRTSYLFIDLTARNVDEVIRYAKLGGFKYILIYANTWASSRGSYPLNLRNYPLGERSLKSVVDKIHDAGLRVGLHTLSSFVSKNDKLVRPVPDPRLLKDAEAILASDIDEKSPEVPVTEPLEGFPTKPSFYGEPNAGLELQIDDEIIQCLDPGVTDPKRLKQCRRAIDGTTASSHRQGTKIYHLAQRFGNYLADLRTSLKDQISERISELINRVGLDMIYFDGGAMNSANGPKWYWVGQQQDSTLRHVNRDLLVQGSAWTQWTWHWFTRGVCSDYAEIATIPFLDHHKIGARWETSRNNFLPAELGWWAILDDTPEHPATMPEEVEHHAIRMIALGAPISLETTLARLKANGRTEEMLAKLGKMEQVRTTQNFSHETRKKLREGRWRWSDSTRSFHPLREVSSYTTVPGRIEIQNPWAAQPIDLRIRVMPMLNEPGALENKILFRPDQPLVLSAPAPNAPMPGTSIRRIRLAPAQKPVAPVNLSSHRAIAVKIKISGDGEYARQPHPVLNVQLESSRKTYRDYYFNLDFAGERTLIIPESNAHAMFPLLTPNPKTYPAKRALRGFDYSMVTALNLRWMSFPDEPPPRIELEAVEALAERESRVVNPGLRIAEALTELPVRLQTGDYMEFSQGKMKGFDRQGRMTQQLTAKTTTPLLQPGQNVLSLIGDGVTPVEVTVTLEGPALQP